MQQGADAHLTHGNRRTSKTALIKTQANKIASIFSIYNKIGTKN